MAPAKRATPPGKGAQPLVSIGLPCYHARIPGIRNALNDMLAQTHTNWELHISDNASPFPEVGAIGREYAKKDKRIHYHRQPHNTGLDNFKLLVDIADRGDYFMWIADDDRWHPAYITECLSMLAGNPKAGLAFPNMEIINLKGRVIGNHGDYARFTHTTSRTASLISYLWEPEVMGKANFLYGVFRRPALRQAMRYWRPRQMERTFGDIVFLFALQTRFPIVCGGRLLNKKGVLSSESAWLAKTPLYQTFNFTAWPSYTWRLLQVSPSLADKALVLAIMSLRLLHKTFIALPLKVFDKLTGTPPAAPYPKKWPLK